MKRKHVGRRVLVGLLAAAMLLSDNGSMVIAAQLPDVTTSAAQLPDGTAYAAQLLGGTAYAAQLSDETAAQMESVNAAAGSAGLEAAMANTNANTDDGSDKSGVVETFAPLSDADVVNAVNAVNVVNETMEAVEAIEAENGKKTISELPSYSYDGTTLRISGTGVFTEDAAKEMKLNLLSYEKVTDIVIEEGVSGLPASCFRDTPAKTVSIPSTLSVISDSAFYNARKLETVKLPTGVTEVNHMAFWHCTSLKELDLGKVTKMGNYVFSGCTALTKVDFPDTLISMGSNCFSDCSALAETTYPVKLTEGSQAFYKCSALKKINWPEYNSKITVPSGLFAYSGLEQVTFPNYVESIGAGVFEFCSQLKSVVIPDSVKKLNDRAFRQCKQLNSVTLGKNVEIIGYLAFDECVTLTEITFPDSVKELQTSAFQKCTGLNKISWPVNATVMYKPFDGCTALKNITIPEGVKSIPELALYGSAVTKITLPSTLTTFGGQMTFMNCSNLTEAVILGKVKTIPASTFSGCKSLTTITLPASIEEIKFGAFKDDGNLTTLNFGGTEAQWKKVKIENMNEPLSSANLKINFSAAGKPDTSSGEATVAIGGKQESASSLAEAFAKITKAGDANAEYTVSLVTDMVNETSFTLPVKAAKVTIKGNGNTITLKATKLTAKTELVLDNVTVNVVNKKTGAAAKLTVTASKNLTFQNETSFITEGLTVKGKKTSTFWPGEVTEYAAVSGFGTVNLSGSLRAKTFSCQTLNMGASSVLAVPAGGKVTVSTLLKGVNGAKITLEEGFKPLALKGEADGQIAVGYSGKDGAKLPDGTQIFTVTKKMTNDMLAKFDVNSMGQAGGIEYGLAKPSAAKACLYGMTIKYGADSYALWKDVIAKAVEKGDQNISVSLNGDTYTYGALKLPKAGTYASISIDGGNHALKFTGNVKLTAPMTLKNVALKGQTAKGVEKAYTIKENVKKGYVLTETQVNWGNIVKK